MFKYTVHTVLGTERSSDDNAINISSKGDKASLLVASPGLKDAL